MSAPLTSISWVRKLLGSRRNDYLNCSSDSVYGLNPFTTYDLVSNRTISPPSFGQFTVCNQTTVILTIYSPQSREAEEVEGTSVGKLELKIINGGGYREGRDTSPGPAGEAGKKTGGGGLPFFRGV